MKRRNELVVVNGDTASTPNPFQNFNVADMQKFYEAKQFLSCVDATPLLKNCIMTKEEVIEYKRTYRQIYSPHCIRGFLGEPVSCEHIYEQDYDVKTETIISTALLMDKLDASMFFWRELNPELVRMLSASAGIRLEIISNWVKMIHYMSPHTQQNAF